MYYLLYHKDGLMKKCPLGEDAIKIGRGRDNDIVLSGRTVSKNHCTARREGGELFITDLNSRNGTFIDDSPVTASKIGLNNSFRIDRTPLYFKQGEIEEFTISSSLSDLFSSCKPGQRPGNDPETATAPINDRLEGILRSLAEKALLDDTSRLFFHHAALTLKNSLNSGALLYFGSPQPHVLLNCFQIKMDDLREVNFWEKPAETTLTIRGQGVPYWKYESSLPRAAHFLVYLNPKPKRCALPPPEFFKRLLEIIEVHLKMVSASALNKKAEPTLYQDEEIAIIGESRELTDIVDQAKRFAPKNSFIIISGESGTGKELIAKMIHRLSGRKAYVALNCAAIPASLLESELFGCEKGAFTDAKERKIGKIEASSGGTLVLDEIGDMPMEAQAKLLRVIQEKSVTRLGGRESVPVDLRIISMSNQDLSGMVAAGRFRQDLFFRLLVHHLNLPPLRRRPSDILPLIRHFAGIYARDSDVAPAGFSKAAEEALIKHPWPGNIRELENEIHRLMETLDNGEWIGNHHLRSDIARASSPPSGSIPKGSTVSVKDKIRETEKKALEELLRKNGGNKTICAKEMGISYRGFLKKVKRLGIS